MTEESGICRLEEGFIVLVIVGDMGATKRKTDEVEE
jgi:hypothetical protein